MLRDEPWHRYRHLFTTAEQRITLADPIHLCHLLPQGSGLSLSGGKATDLSAPDCVSTFRGEGDGSESLVPGRRRPRGCHSTLRLVSSRESVNTILRGYRAFVAGDLDTVAELLDPDIEWFSVAPEQSPADLDEVRTILTARHADGYRIELERCIGKGEDVLVAFRAAGVEKDLDDDRPLQTRRTFTIGRYWAIVTVREGRVVRVRDYPGLRPGLEALGLDEGAL